jgi:O-Antigen ligase
MSGARAVDRLRSLGRAALLALAVLLPFEAIEPLARIGPLQLSSVELPLYLALAVWGAALAAGWLAGQRDLVGRLERAPLAHRAVAGFALVLFLSAALAPASRGAAVKFALRSAGGMLLYAAAADLLRAPGAVARTAKALVAGALIAALLTIAETRTARFAALLHPFHIQTFEALGRPRASGPFQYPNIAAMYLEAVAALAVALGAAALAPGRSVGASASPRASRVGPAVGSALVLLVLLDGVLATASRAGLVGALLVVVALGFFYARGAETRAPAVASLSAVLIVALLASGSTLVGRYRFWQDGDWYRAVVVQAGGPAGRLPSVLAPSSASAESLEVHNLGALPWLRSPPAPINLAYHWLDAATGRVVVLDGVRTTLPTDVFTGGAAQVRARVRAPARPGRYILWWDLVHEHTSWFSQRGSPGLREEIVVAWAGDAEINRPVAGAAAPELAAGMLMRQDPGADGVPRSTLWRAAIAAWRAHPLLGIGPDNFRHLSPQFLGHASDERLHANSLYFETLADLGCAGLLAFAVLIGALAGAARRAAAAPANRVLALGVAAALAAYLLHGLLDYFLEFTPTYALFWLLAGMIVAMDSSGTLGGSPAGRSPAAPTRSSATSGWTGSVA